MLVAGWLFGWFSPDPALAEVKQLQAQLADPNLKDDARRRLFQQMRTQNGFPFLRPTSGNLGTEPRRV